MADKWIQRWEVTSHSNPDKTYVVAIDGDGGWGCSCPVWKFRRLECKHIRQVKETQGHTPPKPQREQPKPAAPAATNTRASFLEF